MLGCPFSESVVNIWDASDLHEIGKLSQNERT